MLASSLMQEEDLSLSHWVGMRIQSGSTTFTVLIPKPLLIYPTLLEAVGSLLKPSNLEALVSGILTITQRQKIVDLSHFFVVPKMDLSPILLRCKDGIGPPKQNLYLILLDKDGCSDRPLILDLLSLLKQCMTKGDYSKSRAILLRDL